MILVIGESARDIFAYGDSGRLAPEAPVPVLQLRQQHESLAMAGNVARNIHALKRDFELRTNEGWQELTKTRYVDLRSNHMFIRIDSEENIPRITNLEEIDWKSYEAVVISDYDKGFLHPEDIKYISRAHPKTFMDSKKILGSWANRIHIIKINEGEYERTKHTLTPHLEKKIITTLGSKGCRYRGKVYPVPEVEVLDTSGLGDTFHASFAVKYLETKGDVEKSIKFANQVATICARKRGVSVIEPDDWKDIHE